jgi:DNA-binding transcriptional regulator YiaG
MVKKLHEDKEYGLKEKRKKSRIQSLSADIKKEIKQATYDPAPIRALMAALECDQSELAEVLGTNKSNVSRWLHGTPPTADYFTRMKRLADACAVAFNPVGDVQAMLTPPAATPAAGHPHTVGAGDYEKISRIEFDPTPIRELRLSLGLPRAAFARAVGANKSVPRDWEDGKYAPGAGYLARMKALAELHGLPFDPL